MKDFKESISTYRIFEGHEIEGWTETEIIKGEKIYRELDRILENEGINGLNDIDEGVFSKIISGVGGFVVGPAVGKIIAKALGVKKGILYDMFSSRLVGAALGAAISKEFSK